MGILSLFGIKGREELVKEALAEGAVVVDVRSPQEFKEGHITSAINIPLPQIEARVSTLKKKNKTIITCCKSGARAGKAKKILESNGLKCVNAGSWGKLNYWMH